MIQLILHHSRFGTNDFLRDYVFTEKTRLNTFVAGLGAGTAEAIAVVTPAETIKVEISNQLISLG